MKPTQWPMCDCKILYTTFVVAIENWECHYPDMSRYNVFEYVGCRIESLVFTDNSKKIVGVPSKEVEQRFNMLAGPYWKTILKAWELKNDRKRD